MSRGRFTLDRRIFDWEWWGDDNTTITFLTLVGHANYKDTKFRGVVVKRGQYVGSLETLSLQTKRSVQKIRTSLKKLKKTGEIVVKSTNKGTIITIVNYDKYQDFGSVAQENQQTNQQTTNKPLTTSNKANKENKEITTTDVVNSTDYFGENVVVVPTVRNELRDRDLWTDLLTLWSTNEYEASNEFLYKTYWTKWSHEEQVALIDFVRTIKNPHLHKIWKRNIFASDKPIEQLKLQLKAQTPKTHPARKVYHNVSDEERREGNPRTVDLNNFYNTNQNE
jgi:hypothetical protein